MTDTRLPIWLLDSIDGCWALEESDTDLFSYCRMGLESITGYNGDWGKDCVKFVQLDKMG